MPKPPPIRLRQSMQCPSCGAEAKGYVSTITLATPCQRCGTYFEVLWREGEPRRWRTVAEGFRQESFDSAQL